MPLGGTEVLNGILREEFSLGTRDSSTPTAASEVRDLAKGEVELLSPEEARRRAGLSGEADGP